MANVGSVIKFNKALINDCISNINQYQSMLGYNMAGKPNMTGVHLHHPSRSDIRVYPIRNLYWESI